MKVREGTGGDAGVVVEVERLSTVADADSVAVDICCGDHFFSCARCRAYAFVI